jgi:hypothetical protein
MYRSIRQPSALLAFGSGAPANTETRCLTAVQIPGNPLRSFDISFVKPDRAEYYFADRSRLYLPQSQHARPRASAQSSYQALASARIQS